MFIQRWLRASKSVIKNNKYREDGFPVDYLVKMGDYPVGHVISVVSKKDNFYCLVNIKIYKLRDYVCIQRGLQEMDMSISDRKSITVDIPIWWKMMKHRYYQNKKLQSKTRKLRKKGLLGRKYREQW